MNLEKVLGKQFAPIEHVVTARDCMLYALGIGVGERPEEACDLQFIYEKGLKFFPSMVNVIAHPGGWIQAPELAVDWLKLLHGEQSFTINATLEPGKTYMGTYQVLDVVDKGPGNGDATAPHPIPDRAPDLSCALTTLARSALIYRLSGDYNPIHADPVLARKAGFERPILHGLCSLGLATRAVLASCCNDEPERLKSLQLRFSAPVYPGETLVTDLWREGNSVRFRSRVSERNVVVLNNGLAELAA